MYGLKQVVNFPFHCSNISVHPIVIGLLYVWMVLLFSLFETPVDSQALISFLPLITWFNPQCQFSRKSPCSMFPFQVANCFARYSHGSADKY